MYVCVCVRWGGGGGVIGIYQVEARDAAKHLIMHKTVPTTQNDLDVNSAKVEKRCLRSIRMKFES